MFSGCVSEAVVELFVYVSLDGGDLFLLSVFFRRRAAPSGLSRNVGLFICWESVVWSCASWARSRGVELKRESMSGDWVVAINVGMIDCSKR